MPTIYRRHQQNFPIQTLFVDIFSRNISNQYLLQMYVFLYPLITSYFLALRCVSILLFCNGTRETGKLCQKCSIHGHPFRIFVFFDVFFILYCLFHWMVYCFFFWTFQAVIRLFRDVVILVLRILYSTFVFT